MQQASAIGLAVEALDLGSQLLALVEQGSGAASELGDCGLGGRDLFGRVRYLDACGGLIQRPGRVGTSRMSRQR